MKKKQIALKQKLSLKKHVITDLKSLAHSLGGDDPNYQSLRCPSMNCTAAVCAPNGSANCQSVFQCAGDTNPGVNKCVLEANQSVLIACPPAPASAGCTLHALDTCAISK